jgi:hypothetical protein
VKNLPRIVLVTLGPRKKAPLNSKIAAANLKVRDLEATVVANAFAALLAPIAKA